MQARRSAQITPNTQVQVVDMANTGRLVSKFLRLDLPPDTSYADKFFLEAGRVMIFWGRFENQLDWGLRMLMGHPKALRFARRSKLAKLFTGLSQSESSFGARPSRNAECRADARARRQNS